MDVNFELKKRIMEIFRTQADFAEAINTHSTIVSDVVRYRRNISDTEKERWAKALKCTVDELFGEPVTQQSA